MAFAYTQRVRVPCTIVNRRQALPSNHMHLCSSKVVTMKSFKSMALLSNAPTAAITFSPWRICNSQALLRSSIQYNTHASATVAETASPPPKVSRRKLLVCDACCSRVPYIAASVRCRKRLL